MKEAELIFSEIENTEELIAVLIFQSTFILGLEMKIH
jgi:hypothetical protein